MRVVVAINYFCFFFYPVYSTAGFGCKTPRPCSELRRCGGTIKKAGSLETPSHPLYYRPCTQCTWRLTVPSGQKVHLRMTSLHLGRGDYVRILDGHKRTSRLLMELVGQQHQIELVSSGRRMTVVFASDELEEDEGFRADFTGTRCGGLVRFRNSKDIRSPTTSRHNADYPSESNCIWFIRGRQMINTIRLQFVTFKTELSKDRVVLEEAISNFGSLKYNWSGVLDGQNSSTVTFTDTAGLLLRFTSDSNIEFRGFHLQATVERSVQDCGPPTPLDQGYVYLHKVKATAEYYCKKGFKLEGPSHRRCVDGQWTSQGITTCAAIDHCPYPVPPENGLVVEKHSNVSAVGTKISISCLPGYSLQGSNNNYKRAKCGCDGQWKYATIPKCIPVQCRLPPSLQNGSLVATPRGPPYYYGAVVNFTCNPGLVLDGIPRRRCLEHGQWDQSFFVHRCIAGGETCPEPTPLSNGVYKVNSYLVGQMLMYGCKEGYRLQGSVESCCRVTTTGQPFWDGTPPSCIDTYDNPQKAAARLVSTFVDRFVACSHFSTSSNVTSHSNTGSVTERLSTLTAASCNTRSSILVGTGIDVVFVVDCSGSVGRDNFQQILKLISVIVSLFDGHGGRARFAMVTYDTQQYLQFGFNSSLSLSDIIQKIQAARFCGGGTATRTVLEYVDKSVLKKSRKASEKVVFFVTDGKTNWAGSPIDSAKSIRKRKGTSIYCIAFGSQVNKEEIEEIASRKDYVIRVRTSNDVYKVADAIEIKKKNYSECGVSVVPDCRIRVIGGCGSLRGARPWMAGIYFNSNGHCNFLCGGTLIGSCWILTAAHCFDRFSNVSRNIDQLYVVVGDTVRDVTEGTEKIHGIQGVIKHPNYNASLKIYDYDAALIKLSCSVTYSPFVRRACLPRAGDEQLYKRGIRGVVAGWGVFSPTDRMSSNLFSNRLREAELPVTEWTTCRTKLGLWKRKVTERMFCAGDGRRPIDACLYDSGGPFVVRRHTEDRYTLTGIVSWGIGCAQKGTYGVYTDVMSIMRWIQQTTESTGCPNDNEICPTISCKGIATTKDRSFWDN